MRGYVTDTSYAAGASTVIRRSSDPREPGIELATPGVTNITFVTKGATPDELRAAMSVAVELLPASEVERLRAVESKWAAEVQQAKELQEKAEARVKFLERKAQAAVDAVLADPGCSAEAVGRAVELHAALT